MFDGCDRTTKINPIATANVKKTEITKETATFLFVRTILTVKDKTKMAKIPNKWRGVSEGIIVS